ncbi:MAG: thioredoxin domain-containing protein [Pseudomonadota bacterium]
MTRLLATAAAIVVMGGGGYWYFTQDAGTATAQSAASEDSAMASAAGDGLVVDMSIGDPDAPVTVIEYASFTCPHCQTFHEGAFKDLKKDYIDTGKVNFVFREVYFDRPGLWAGMVARCGGPDRYFGIVDELFRQQQVWARASTAEAIASELRKIGLTAGLEPETLEACLSDAEKAQAMVDAYETNAATHGIRSTPSFVINGTTHNNMNYADFSRLIDDEIGS